MRTDAVASWDSLASGKRKILRRASLWVNTARSDNANTVLFELKQVRLAVPLRRRHVSSFADSGGLAEDVIALAAYVYEARQK